MRCTWPARCRSSPDLETFVAYDARLVAAAEAAGLAVAQPGDLTAGIRGSAAAEAVADQDAEQGQHRAAGGAEQQRLDVAAERARSGGRLAGERPAHRRRRRTAASAVSLAAAADGAAAIGTTIPVSSASIALKNWPAIRFATPVIIRCPTPATGPPTTASAE